LIAGVADLNRVITCQGFRIVFKAEQENWQAGGSLSCWVLK